MSGSTIQKGRVPRLGDDACHGPIVQNKDHQIDDQPESSHSPPRSLALIPSQSFGPSLQQRLFDGTKEVQANPALTMVNDLAP